jgi:RNA polymerase sigma-70 factor (ECF subfamily)
MTDDAIMQAVRDGRVEQLAVLFERHHIALYGFFVRLTGNRAVSEDLVQDVFIRILKYRASYHGEDKFAVWMYKIARNAHIDHLRKRKDSLPLDGQTVEPAHPGDGPAEQAERGAEASLIAKALDELSPRKKEVLMLSRYQNLKYREIAELLDCPVGTVKGLVHRAVAELGEIYARLTQETCRHEM